MSRRSLLLPLRFASSTTSNHSRNAAPWVCRRCLATQAEANTGTTASAADITQLISGLDSHLETDAQSSSIPRIIPEWQRHPDPPAPFASEPLPEITSERLAQFEKAWAPGDGPPNNLPPEQRINPITGAATGPVNKKIEELLRTPIGHSIPQQLLQQSTTDLLPEEELAARERARLGGMQKEIVGAVISQGKMDKTVKVRVLGRRWEGRIGKHFGTHTDHLVHDPNNSLLAGDVVQLHRLRTSAVVHHIIARIVAPFGTPAHLRAPIPTPDERLALWKEQRLAKLHRRSLRFKATKGDADAIEELKALGLDPTQQGAEGLKGKKGQKLPPGVLPGGKHAVGKIDARAKHNKQKAMRMNERAEGNLLEARKRREQVEGRGVSGDALSGITFDKGRPN